METPARQRAQLRRPGKAGDMKALIAEAAKSGAFDVHGVFFSIPP